MSPCICWKCKYTSAKLLTNNHNGDNMSVFVFFFFSFGALPLYRFKVIVDLPLTKGLTVSKLIIFLFFTLLWCEVALSILNKWKLNFIIIQWNFKKKKTEKKKKQRGENSTQTFLVLLQTASKNQCFVWFSFDLMTLILRSWRWNINSVAPKCLDRYGEELWIKHLVTLSGLFHLSKPHPSGSPQRGSNKWATCQHFVTLICLGLKWGNRGLMGHVRDPSCSSFLGRSVSLSLPLSLPSERKGILQKPLVWRLGTQDFFLFFWTNRPGCPPSPRAPAILLMRTAS